MDGVQLAILNKRFEAICRKMANTLFRTGRSGVLNTARDFSCCIVTADCELLATAESLPIHVLSGPDLMAASMKEFHPDLERGDAFLHNSPYHGCSHPADHTILVPVIDDAGVHRFTVVAKAHQADCGNSIATTYHGSARDVYEEGALIFPAVQVQRGYETIDDIVRMCRMRIRVPDQWWGDFLAMLGAARVGERELLALAEEAGWETLDRFSAEWFDYSERRMVDALEGLPAGSLTVASTHDPTPGAPEGVTVKVAVRVDPAASRIEVDLRDNGDSLPFGLNMSEACARTSAMVGIFNALPHTVPPNAGAFRRIDVKLRRGCVVGIPEHPTSCSVATTNVADHIANGVQRAIAELGDGHGMAEVGGVIPPSCGVISGTDPRSGAPFVNQIFLGFGAGAAAPETDAWITIAHVGNAGLCYQDSIEVDEMVFPLTVKGRHFITDSGGAGRQRGGAGAFVEFGPVEGCLLEVGYVSNGGVNPANGARGGGTRRPRRPVPPQAQRRAGGARGVRTGGGGTGGDDGLHLRRRRRLRRALRPRAGACGPRRAGALGLAGGRPRYFPRGPSMPPAMSTKPGPAGSGQTRPRIQGSGCKTPRSDPAFSERRDRMKVDGACFCGQITYEAELDTDRILDLQLYGLSDALRLGVPHGGIHHGERLHPALRRAQGLRQDRGQRQSAPAGLLRQLRLTHLCDLGPGRAVLRPPCRHHRPARPTGPEGPHLQPLEAALARPDSLAPHHRGHALGRRDSYPHRTKRSSITVSDASSASVAISISSWVMVKGGPSLIVFGENPLI